ncbi:hypothetical protein LCGC14_2122900 [marine sediment metagenome]|uniref:Uncharacterized protein n=1 Tax=marine sediment metagenome TaxID=412755 RepID=A0A0F9GGS5_9ZZZZ
MKEWILKDRLNYDDEFSEFIEQSRAVRVKNMVEATTTIDVALKHLNIKENMIGQLNSVVIDFGVWLSKSDKLKIYKPKKGEKVKKEVSYLG